MSEALRTPTLGKLAGALIYDGMVLIGLLTGILVLATILATVLDLPDKTLPVWFGRLLWTILIVSGLGYFLYSWSRGGQTLGLRAWQLRLVTAQGHPVPPKQGAIRGLVALLSIAAAGLGFVWILVDSQRRTWHDLAAGTRLVISD